METLKIFIPALRGLFGDWVYYSCLMPLPELAERVSFADELHNNKQLSKLIQRKLKTGRAPEITKYLKNEKQRFFNSLVIAVYGAEPVWYSVGIKSNNPEINAEELNDTALYSLGLLSLTGKEKLFAIDGQHRLAGIKEAIKECEELSDDEVSVIFVAHSNTDAGLKRTRRLFTTLNKTAVPVSKGEIIALDENDVMAIVVRRMVEENKYFDGDRIAYRETNNLLQNDTKALTTIANLYDLLLIIFTKIMNQEKNKTTIKELKFGQRPSDHEINQYYTFASCFFESLIKNNPQLNEYFDADAYTDIVKKYRGTFGGNVLYRPIGLTIFTEVISFLCKKRKYEDSIKLASKLPLNLDTMPYANVIWDNNRHVIMEKGRVLVRKLLLYMLGEITNKTEINKIKTKYAATLGVNVDDVTMPPKI